MMDMQPRQLPVFGRVPHTTAEAPLPAAPTAQAVISAARIHTLNADAHPRLRLIAGLGYGDAHSPCRRAALPTCRSRPQRRRTASRWSAPSCPPIPFPAKPARGGLD
jgi:hypothetical protein